MYEDIYFLNPQEALRVASQQNRWGGGAFLQVCYYNGEKIESDLPNLIQLPLNNLLEGLAHGIYRLPSQINFDGLELSPEIQSEIEANFKLSITQVREYRQKLNTQYLQKAKSAKPDFKEPLRFYLHASANTDVMQHMSKNIAQALESMGYDVLFNLYIGMEDLECFKLLSEFNPHAVININHFNNQFISEDVFNFIWVQDMFAAAQLSQSNQLRKRDVVFHLIHSLAHLLSMKNIESLPQGFCINTGVYKHRDSIKRENKIVMIGSSYKKVFNEVQHKEKNKIAKLLLKFYLSNEDNTLANFQKYFIYLKEKFNVATNYELGTIVNYVERDLILSEIAKMNLDYELEVYGWGWESTPLKSFYKGVLPYGEDISKVYNSAKYALVLGGYVLQQRTLEAAASGCIPLVFETPNHQVAQEDESCFEKSLVFFKKLGDLPSILNKNHSLDLNCIVESNSYQTFAQKMINIINTKS